MSLETTEVQALVVEATNNYAVRYPTEDQARGNLGGIILVAECPQQSRSSPMPWSLACSTACSPSTLFAPVRGSRSGS